MYIKLMDNQSNKLELSFLNLANRIELTFSLSNYRQWLILVPYKL